MAHLIGLLVTEIPYLSVTSSAPSINYKGLNYVTALLIIQSDGQTKVVNRSLEHYLRCYIVDKPSSWAELLHWAKWWYNTPPFG